MYTSLGRTCVLKAISQHEAVLVVPSGDHLRASFLIVFISRLNHCYDERNECLNTKIANVWSQIKPILVIFNHLKLWVAAARHNLNWVKNLNYLI